jgi:hypothetical protein
MGSLTEARGGETALSPERKGDPPGAAMKEGARGGTMGSPTSVEQPEAFAAAVLSHLEGMAG